MQQQFKNWRMCALFIYQARHRAQYSSSHCRLKNHGLTMIIRQSQQRMHKCSPSALNNFTSMSISTAFAWKSVSIIWKKALNNFGNMSFLIGSSIRNTRMSVFRRDITWWLIEFGEREFICWPTCCPSQISACQCWLPLEEATNQTAAYWAEHPIILLEVIWRRPFKACPLGLPCMVQSQIIKKTRHSGKRLPACSAYGRNSYKKLGMLEPQR